MNKTLQPEEVMVAVESLKEKAYHDFVAYLDKLPDNLKDKRLLIHLTEAIAAQLIVETSDNHEEAVEFFVDNLEAHIDYLTTTKDKNRTHH